MGDSTTGHTAPHTYPVNDFKGLPESQSTNRLLDALARLESFHANLAAASGSIGRAQLPAPAGGVSITSELNHLRAENKKLRQRQRHAVERLDDLLAKLPGLENAYATQLEISAADKAADKAADQSSAQLLKLHADDETVTSVSTTPRTQTVPETSSGFPVKPPVKGHAA